MSQITLKTSASAEQTASSPLAWLSRAGFGVIILLAIALFGWFLFTRGMADTWTPSMAAAVAFFGCCAGVLYATSVPQPVLPPEDGSNTGH